MLRAMRAENSLGRASASSNAFVCRDWVPPSTAARASMVVRTTLLYGSRLVRLAPEVWQWVRSMSERGSFGANFSSMRVAQSQRAARSFATSMKKSMPIPKKNESRGAKRSTSSPLSRAARTYSTPSARVNASSCTLVAPASSM